MKVPARLTPHATDRQAHALPKRQLYTVFAALLLAMLLAALDATIVATALPTIVGELGGLERLSWVVTAYLLAQTAVIPLYGKLGDLYGRKVVLQSAIVIFLGGSVLCGASTSLPMLILFRAIQGLGGGGLMVTSQAALSDLVSARQRGRYQGILGAAFGVASVAGPIIGGFFTTHLSWRWIFYINLPLGAIALTIIAAAMPARTEIARRRLDYAGALLLAAALGAIVLVTDLGGLAYPWSSPPIVSLVLIAIAALAALIAVEKRASEPILPLRMFRNRTFVVAASVGTCVGFALFGSVTFLPLFLQVVKGLTPTASGLHLMPMMAGTLTTSIVSGQLISRFGRYRPYPIAGTAIAATALTLLSRITADVSLTTLTIYLLMLGLGLGMVTQVIVVAVQNATPFADLGVATSGATLFRLIGGSIGTAVLGTIFASTVGATLAGYGGATEASVLRGISATMISGLSPEMHQAYLDAFTRGITSVFVVAACVAATGFVVTWFLPGAPLRETVAAAASTIRQEAGEPFSMPVSGDASDQLLRGLIILADRDVQRAYIEGIARRAGVDLGAAATWLVLRLHDDPALDLEPVARRAGIPRERIDAALVSLRDRNYIVETSGTAPGTVTRTLTAAGRDVYDKLAAARRARLQELGAEWPAEQREQLAHVLRRLANELVPRA
jgi:EmrB/QacA subfamily drug resistance transporter